VTGARGGTAGARSQGPGVGTLAVLLCLTLASTAGAQTRVSLGGAGGARYAAALPPGGVLRIRAAAENGGDTALRSWRGVSALVRQGEKARAIALADSLAPGGRPRRSGDFTRALLDMLAYVRGDGALVVGAGVRELWANLEPGVRVAGLRTPEGTLELSMFAGGRRVKVHLGGSMEVPAAGIVVHSPYDSPVLTATVDGKPAEIVDRRYVVIRSLPADVAFGH